VKKAPIHIISTINNLRSDADRFLQHFAQAVNSEVINNSVYIKGHRGMGVLRCVEVMEGLNLFSLDLQLKSMHQFALAWPDTVSSSSFIMVSTLTHESLELQKGTTGTEWPNTLFGSGKQSIHFTIHPDQRARAVILQMDAQWLRNEFREADPDLIFLVRDLVSPQAAPSLFAEQSSFSLFHTLNEMNLHGLKLPADTFYLKGKAISVIYEILNRLLIYQGSHSKEAAKGQQVKMIAVEKILEDHLQKSLPSLQAIAKEVALSESTLKRSFKQAYSASIYEFYLQKKMQLARQLLEEKGMAVKEVAYALGYEKSSNFIKIFKKHYDFSPGLLKKKFKS
jgi:AraC-like DNA-binding protein